MRVVTPGGAEGSFGARIVSRTDGRVHPCVFAPVRVVQRQAIGWVSLDADGARLRFPAVHCPGLQAGADFVAPADWRDDRAWRRDDGTEIDLADPEAVRTLISTEAGRFMWCKPPRNAGGGLTSVAEKFARS